MNSNEDKLYIKILPRESTPSISVHQFVSPTPAVRRHLSILSSTLRSLVVRLAAASDADSARRTISKRMMRTLIKFYLGV